MRLTVCQGNMLIRFSESVTLPQLSYFFYNIILSSFQLAKEIHRWVLNRLRGKINWQIFPLFLSCILTLRRVPKRAHTTIFIQMDLPGITLINHLSYTSVKTQNKKKKNRRQLYRHFPCVYSNAKPTTKYQSCIYDIL